MDDISYQHACDKESGNADLIELPCVEPLPDRPAGQILALLST